MSIIIAMQCDCCHEIESLDGVAQLSFAHTYQTPWGDYQHVCEACLEKLQDEEEASEEEEAA